MAAIICILLRYVMARTDVVTSRIVLTLSLTFKTWVYRHVMFSVNRNIG